MARAISPRGQSNSRSRSELRGEFRACKWRTHQQHTRIALHSKTPTTVLTHGHTTARPHANGPTPNNDQTGEFSRPQWPRPEAQHHRPHMPGTDRTRARDGRPARHVPCRFAAASLGNRGLASSSAARPNPSPVTYGRACRRAPVAPPERPPQRQLCATATYGVPLLGSVGCTHTTLLLFSRNCALKADLGLRSKSRPRTGGRRDRPSP